MTPAQRRHALRDAFARGLAAVSPEDLVRRAMPRPPRGVGAGAIVAVGKAAPAMARGALSVAGDWCTRVLVIAPDGTDAHGGEGSWTLDDPGVELLRAAHPHPDARSVAAARRALEVAGAADFVLALVSGGASSLVCLPEGMPLARYVRVVRALLLGGATVREVNVVRRHLCAIKGGGLARAAGGPVRTLAMSDVLGGALHDVGSGPSVPDPTTRAQAAALLSRFAPRLRPPPLHESWKGRPASRRGSRASREASPASRVEARILAGPEDLARAVAAELRGSFARVRVMPPSQAPLEELAREYAALALTLRPREALVRAAEPSLRVDAPRPGRGGRSTHLAARLALSLPPDVAFLAAASDGVDGASGTAGALLDGSLLHRLPRAALEASLAAFDTGALLRSARVALPEHPSGTNLADLHVLAR